MKLYNTLTRKTEQFTPREEDKVSLYVCGLTVYSQPHIGNWVAYIYWDILVRTLRANGFKVTHVQNITDVGHLTSDEDAGEDKMLKGALKEGMTAWEVAEKYIRIADHEAYELLNLTRPTHMPRATDYIQQQIKFVELLEEKGFTYVISDGVYFDTSKLNDYGKLARLDIDGLQFGARVENTGKKNPTDFALWKFSNPHEKRDMEWDSPWGTGFPGWHLECSVMSRELLGDQIDIHTGGIDHIPVHHTNEIAQSEAVSGKQFSNYWLHANHIKVDGTKMSKSLGNIHTLQDILNRGYDLEAFKLLVLGKHYQTEGNFTWENMTAAQNRLEKLRALADLRWQTKKVGEWVADTNTVQIIIDNLNTNLDTAKVLSILSEFAAKAEDIFISEKEKETFTNLLVQIDNLLGLTLSKRTDITNQQKNLLALRENAREAKDWKKSDEIRDQLKSQDIDVRDTEHGPIWSKR